jgi:hypothetical protein
MAPRKSGSAVPKKKGGTRNTLEPTANISTTFLPEISYAQNNMIPISETTPAALPKQKLILKPPKQGGRVKGASRVAKPGDKAPNARGERTRKKSKKAIQAEQALEAIADVLPESSPVAPSKFRLIPALQLETNGHLEKGRPKKTTEDSCAYVSHHFQKSPQLSLLVGYSNTPSTEPETERSSELPQFSDDLISKITTDVRNLYDVILSIAEFPTTLPEISRPHPDHPDDESYEIVSNYDAQTLFGLYMLAYSQNEYHTCDLVADAWIKEFQRVNRTSKNFRMWRENRTAQYVAAMAAAEENGEFMEHAESALSHDVLEFNPHLLTTLYNITDSTCGARLLWADAMALCGQTLEDKLARQRRDNWHPELIWNLMCTSLRLTRIRRTLKIEDRDPKEWCDRYHEHGKHGAPCYRDIAKAQKEDQDNAARKAERKAKRDARKERKKKDNVASVTDGGDNDDLEAAMLEGLGAAENGDLDLETAMAMEFGNTGDVEMAEGTEGEEDEGVHEEVWASGRDMDAGARHVSFADPYSSETLDGGGGEISEEE